MEFLIVIGILVVVVAVVAFVDNKNKQIVLKNSERIQELVALNGTVRFKSLRERYSRYQACNSKRQFDNFFIDDYLVALIDDDETFYRNLLHSLEENGKVYGEYTNAVSKIHTKATAEFCQEIKFKLEKFIKYEERLFKSRVLRKPQTDVTIYCKVTYTSPKGKNYYWKDQSYRYKELKKFFDYTIQLKEKRQTRQYQIKMERAKMSDSLRYDILKRDDFSCQLCGSKAQDGVKLHVDHIVPVAKGGRTEPSNLRTLCDRCNMGKRDKI